MSVQLLARDATDPRLPADVSARPTDPVPGVLRLKLGDAIVTALLDGSIDLPLALFPRTDELEAAAVLEREFAQMPVRAALNAFLVQQGGRTVLIDTGAATGLGPSLGRLPAALAAAGVDPASIDVVAMTHLHPDHVNGLLAPRLPFRTPSSCCTRPSMPSGPTMMPALACPPGCSPSSTPPAPASHRMPSEPAFSAAPVRRSFQA